MKKPEPPTLIAIRTATLVTAANQSKADPAKNKYSKMLQQRRECTKILKLEIQFLSMKKDDYQCKIPPELLEPLSEFGRTEPIVVPANLELDPFFELSKDLVNIPLPL